MTCLVGSQWRILILVSSDIYRIDEVLARAFNTVRVEPNTL
jgi:hypothetical protein